METETKAWTPEVGKTAWTFVTNDGVVESLDKVEIIHEKGEFFAARDSEGYVFMRKGFSLYPTAEAALQSIKVYDLEGNQVDVGGEPAQVGNCLSGLEMQFYEFCKKDKTMIEEFAMWLLENGKEFLNGGPSPHKPIPIWTEAERKAIQADAGIYPIDELPADIRKVKAAYKSYDLNDLLLKNQRYEDALREIAVKTDNFFVSADYPDPSEYLSSVNETAVNAIFHGATDAGKLAKTETSMDLSYKPNQDAK